MSVDARIIWKLSVALMCTQGAWVMQLLSGVRDDCEAGSVRNGVADDTIFCGISGGCKDRGAAMKGQNDGKIIDLFEYRCRRDWAAYARAVDRNSNAPVR